MASTRRRPCASACARKSVEVSMRIDRTDAANGEPPLPDSTISIRIDGRVRRSRGSVEWHTAQSQPIIGTPCEVPLPSTVTLTFNNPLSAARDLEETHPQLVEHLLEHLSLLGRQVAAGFLFEQTENVDHLRRPFEVGRAAQA